jgi:hypothetical protein
MKDYVLKEKPEPASNEMVWAFDLGNVPRPSDGRGWRAATGEGCNWADEVNKIFHHTFLHKASPLIPAEFALPRGRECCACLRRPRSRFSHGAKPKPPPVAAGRLEPKAPDETAKYAKYAKEKRLNGLPAISFLTPCPLP